VNLYFKVLLLAKMFTDETKTEKLSHSKVKGFNEVSKHFSRTPHIKPMGHGLFYQLTAK
jgi:hypothetical protein